LKPLVCVYCEGNDTKIAVVEKEKDKVKVIRAASFDVVHTSMDLEEGVSELKIEGEEINFEGETKVGVSPGVAMASQTLAASALKGLNLSKHEFIPALTEPTIYYHVFEGSRQQKSGKITQEIVSDIQATKNVVVDRESLGYIELADKSILSVFLSGEISCVNMINSLARQNGKRYYKIPTIKSAELSLAYYVAKRKKFFPDDQSLLVYIGKEYSKLIFLHGRKVKHIGTTLDIGTLNLHTYDVYFSKILLEMENGGISALDNIVVCGEDDSENLILSFYGTFPEANVSRLEFDDLDIAPLDAKTKETISAYSIPLAVAVEYYDELAEEYKGINLLPKWVKEEQKTFQFAWHGYLMLPLLFLAALYITVEVLKNNQELNTLDAGIAEKTILQRQNQQMLGKVSELQAKISGFDQTQAILDSAAVGTRVWTKVYSDISNFFGGRKNIWLTRLSNDSKDKVVLEGYALSKKVITDFAYSIESAELKSVIYEALRDANTYKFTIIFNLLQFSKIDE
jgi:hypothetical protein